MLYSEECEIETGENNPTILRANYANLSIDEKYKYVVKAVSLAPDVNQTTLLSKDEQRIFKGLVKPTPTAYSLFVKETFQKIKDKVGAQNAFTEASNRWKELDEKKKQIYTQAARIVSIFFYKKKKSIEMIF